MHVWLHMESLNCCGCWNRCSAVHRTVLKGKNSCILKCICIILTQLTLSCDICCKLCTSSRVLWCLNNIRREKKLRSSRVLDCLKFCAHKHYRTHNTPHTLSLYTHFTTATVIVSFFYCWPYKCAFFLSQGMQYFPGKPQCLNKMPALAHCPALCSLVVSCLFHTLPKH